MVYKVAGAGHLALQTYGGIYRLCLQENEDYLMDPRLGRIRIILDSNLFFFLKKEINQSIFISMLVAWDTNIRYAHVIPEAPTLLSKPSDKPWWSVTKRGVDHIYCYVRAWLPRTVIGSTVSGT